MGVNNTPEVFILNMRDEPAIRSYFQKSSLTLLFMHFDNI